MIRQWERTQLFVDIIIFHLVDQSLHDETTHAVAFEVIHWVVLRTPLCYIKASWKIACTLEETHYFFRVLKIGLSLGSEVSHDETFSYRAWYKSVSEEQHDAVEV